MALVKELVEPKYTGQIPRNQQFRPDRFHKIERFLDTDPRFKLSSRAPELIREGNGLIADEIARAIISIYEENSDIGWSSSDITGLMIQCAENQEEVRNYERFGGILPYYLYELYEDGILIT
jgi:hypothetical protein